MFSLKFIAMERTRWQKKVLEDILGRCEERERIADWRKFLFEAEKRGKALHKYTSLVVGLTIGIIIGLVIWILTWTSILNLF